MSHATSADAFAYKKDAKLQERLATEMRALLKRPANSMCADCGADRTVRFCSVTLGVFLCNRCYAIHRSVGAHVTRTKCIGLDAWAPAEVEFMAAHGNARVNVQYEASLPPTVQKPTAQTADREVERWIRDKYERKRYFGDPVPAPAPGGGGGICAAAVGGVAGGAAVASCSGVIAAPPTAAVETGLPSAVAAPFEADFSAAFGSAPSTQPQPVAAATPPAPTTAPPVGDLISF